MAVLEPMNVEALGLDRELVDNIYRSIVDVSPMPVYVCAGEDMIVLFANQATLKAWGKDSAVVGKKFSEALPEMNDQPFLKLHLEVYRTGIPYYTESQQVHFEIDGKMQSFYYKISYQALRDHEHNIWGVLCMASDVTDLVLANQRVEESEQRFKDLILKAPVALCVLKGSSFIVEVANERMLEIWGVEEDQVLFKPVFDGIPEARGQGFEQILENVYKTGQSFVAEERPIVLPAPGGVKEKIVNLVYDPYYLTDNVIAGVIAAAIDVTDLVKARKKVEEINEQFVKTQQRLELALQGGSLGAYEQNLETGKITSSRQCRINVGLPPDEELTEEAFTKAILPDYRDDVQLLRSIRDGQPFDMEIPFMWPDGTVRWLRFSGRCLNNDSGERVLSGVSQDITEQKHLQQRKDDFISIASHELKTPITGLKASLQLLDPLKKDPASPMLPKLIEQANVSLSKVSQLIDDLLNASKMTEGKLTLRKTWINLADLVNNCCNHVGDLEGHNLQIEGDTGLLVYADEHRIDQVLVNFISNAVKYAPHAKTIRVVFEKNDGHAKVSVTDYGPGISKEKLPHIFDRYFRVDETGKRHSGFGLGLYIAAQIIKRHAGEIGADSELGKGSTFWFTLPLEKEGS